MNAPYPPQLRKEIHQALRNWYSIDSSHGTCLESLLLVKLARHSAKKEGKRLAVNQVLLKGLEELGEKNGQGVSILRRRFLDQLTSREIAYQDNLTEDSINRLQRKALDQLAGSIWSQEAALRASRVLAIESHLPAPTYAHLIGFDAYVDTIVEQISAEHAPYVIAIAGIGGIGKTALADKALRTIISRFVFDEVIAIRIEHATLSGKAKSPEHAFAQMVAQLHAALPDMPLGTSTLQQEQQIYQRLREQQHLILIDNVEDAADAAYLFLHVNNWAKPSKFLITTRARPSADRAIAIHNLTELNATDALDLIRYEANQRHIEELANAPTEALLPIYNVTGGNPMALKLTIRLAEVLPLPAILVDLQQGSSKSTEAMYRHIYRQAWQTLSDSSRILLESMPLVGDSGATPEQILAVTGLSETELWPAIQQLSARSLLEVRGTVWERRYGIHRLTETFLHSDIIGW